MPCVNVAAMLWRYIYSIVRLSESFDSANLKWLKGIQVVKCRNDRPSENWIRGVSIWSTALVFSIIMRSCLHYEMCQWASKTIETHRLEMNTKKEPKQSQNTEMESKKCNFDWELIRLVLIAWSLWALVFILHIFRQNVPLNRWWNPLCTSER